VHIHSHTHTHILEAVKRLYGIDDDDDPVGFLFFYRKEVLSESESRMTSCSVPTGEIDNFGVSDYLRYTMRGLYLSQSPSGE